MYQVARHQDRIHQRVAPMPRERPEPVDRDLALLGLFTCPLCDSLIYPRYYQCERLHAICEGCLDQIPSRCPYCGGQKPHVSNYRMEEMARSIVFPCPNKIRGCTIECFGDDWDTHVDQCTFKP